MRVFKFLSGSILKNVVMLIVMLTLASCATSPDTRTYRSTRPSLDIETRIDEGNLASLLEQANKASSPEAEKYFLEASRELSSSNRKSEALNILNRLETEKLDLTLTAEILLLRAQLYLLANQASLATEILNSPRLNALPQLPRSLQLDLHMTRAEAFLETNNFLESAKESIYVDQLLPENALAQNHEKIWNSLIAMSAEQLAALAENEINFEFQGWYELGVIGKAYQYNLDRQLIELEYWRQSKVRHPASIYLPQALLLVETMARERPDSIALLLPLGSSAGRVVRDGFMSAYFNVQEIGGKVPSLTLYNTSLLSDSTEIPALHRQALEDGATMIIGPLLKQNVAQLQKIKNLGVITLALNNVDGIPSNHDLFYQFALSPEVEARQIATQAWLNGHRYAAILSPQDVSDNDPLARKRDTFIQEWQKLGGKIVAQEKFIDDYTGTVESLLDLSDSEYRKETLSDLIGKSLEFTQRRRQDIDFIFLIAQPGPARQINPRLSYLYAGDIPVYASQDIYSGIPSPLEDIDLNGILFSDSPWILGDNDDLKSETQLLFPQTTARNLRLQAFGIDAFRLYPRLKQLDTVPDSYIYGASGLLTMSPDRKISRELSWAKIEEGNASLVNPAE